MVMTLTSEMIVREGGWMQLSLKEVTALLARVVDHPIPQGAHCTRETVRVCSLCHALYRPQPRPLYGPAPVAHQCAATREVRVAQAQEQATQRADAERALLGIIYGLTPDADPACADLLLQCA